LIQRKPGTGGLRHLQDAIHIRRGQVKHHAGRIAASEDGTA